MQLYIPRLGETIKLESDWNFKLYPESRNQGLIEHFGYRLLPHPETRQHCLYSKSDLGEFFTAEQFVKTSDIPFDSFDTWKGSQSPLLKFSSDYRLREKYFNERDKYIEKTPTFIERNKAYEEFRKLLIKFPVEFAQVTLPKDTVLKIDRIYIRKGGADYDSLSFFAEHPSLSGKKRFWAKLNDVNQIQFTK